MNKIINLNTLLNALEEEYDNQKREILEEAKKSFEKTVQEYREEAEKKAEEELKKIVDDAEKKAEIILQKKISEAELNARWELLKEKEEAFYYILNRFLEEFYKQSYYDMAREIFFWYIYRTLKALNVDKCIIRIGEKADRLVDRERLRRKLKEDGIRMQLTFKKDKSIEDGSIIEALDGKLRVECTVKGMIAKDEDLIKNLINEKIFEREGDRL